MRFAAGDHVHVQSLGKGVVREVRNGGRYLVEIKGASLVVEGDRLEAVDEARPKRRDSSQPSAAIPPSHASSGSVPTIDLHGMTAVEAEQAVDQFINDALLAGASEARVIHGRSGGRLKATVLARVKQMPSVRRFQLDPRNPGVTIVWF
jgi:DNA mismatch repair protein MutS2